MYRTITLLVRPDTLLLILGAIGLGMLWWRRLESTRRLLLVTAAWTLLWLICTPAVSHLADLTLISQYPPLHQPPAESQAIVVLSGYATPSDERGFPARLGEDTLQRCLLGAELYRRSPRPLMVTGGVVDPDGEVPPLGLMMREFLVSTGVPGEAIQVEQRSTTTYENAVRCAELLKPQGLHNVVLVTDDRHMPRAAACFRKAGLLVTAAPVRTGGGDFEWALESLLPTAGSAVQFNATMHEWLGLLWYRWHGRI